MTADNFRKFPSTPDTHLTNPMSHLPKTSGQSPWPGGLTVSAEAELRFCMVSVLVSIGTSWIGLSFDLRLSDILFGPSFSPRDGSS
jgi:hypothetical protein